MLVEILDTDRRGHLQKRTYLCEKHARELADGEGLRWPEPHEHSARSTFPRTGDKTDVRVFKDRDGACEYCAAPSEAELNQIVKGEDTADRRFDELMGFVLGPRPE